MPKFENGQPIFLVNRNKAVPGTVVGLDRTMKIPAAKPMYEVMLDDDPHGPPRIITEDWIFEDKAAAHEALRTRLGTTPVEDHWKSHTNRDFQELENKQVHVTIIKRGEQKYHVMAHDWADLVDTIDETIETDSMSMAKLYVLNMLKIKASEHAEKLKGFMAMLTEESENIKALEG
ncbi:MAG: hypothetical protein HDQ88_08270 [Clostridia bacterium]|nr:hypothetical protein [Clostridia bacterium]